MEIKAIFTVDEVIIQSKTTMTNAMNLYDSSNIKIATKIASSKFNSYQHESKCNNRQCSNKCSSTTRQRNNNKVCLMTNNVPCLESC